MPLYLPKGVKPSSKWTKRPKPAVQPVEHPGKKPGAVTGSWIHDLVALRKAIILCWRCQPKFDHKRARYYKDERFPHVIGRCDGCKEHMNHSTKLYIHESFLGGPGGQTKSGQVWTPL